MPYSINRTISPTESGCPPFKGVLERCGHGAHSLVFDIREGDRADWVAKVSPHGSVEKYSDAEIESRLRVTKKLYDLYRAVFSTNNGTELMGNVPDVLVLSSYFLLGEGSISYYGKLGEICSSSRPRDYIIQQRMCESKCISDFTDEEYHEVLPFVETYFKGICRLHSDRVEVNNSMAPKLSIPFFDPRTNGYKKLKILLPQFIEIGGESVLNRTGFKRAFLSESMPREKGTKMLASPNVKFIRAVDGKYHPVIFDFGRGNTIFDVKSLLQQVMNEEEVVLSRSLSERKKGFGLSDQDTKTCDVLEQKAAQIPHVRNEIIARRVLLLDLLSLKYKDEEKYNVIIARADKEVVMLLKDFLGGG